MNLAKIQKFQKLFAAVTVAAVLLLPSLIFAQTTFKDLVNKIIENINYLIFLVVDLAVFVFIWGIFKYFVAGANEKKVEEAKNVLIYGLLGIFIILSVWGLINILIGTFSFGSVDQPEPPQFNS